VGIPWHSDGLLFANSEQPRGATSDCQPFIHDTQEITADEQPRRRWGGEM